MALWYQNLIPGKLVCDFSQVNRNPDLLTIELKSHGSIIEYGHSLERHGY